MGGDVAQYLARAWHRFREIEICNYFSYKIMLGVLLILYVLLLVFYFLVDALIICYNQSMLLTQTK
jgi:hypothetical protein